mgnify:CR=1 FL=1
MPMELDDKTSHPLNGQAFQPQTTHGEAVQALLPGQLAIDEGLVDETVADLNAAFDRGGLATIRALAIIVLDKMFRDEADRFLSDSEHHLSYIAVAQHPALAVSKSALWYAVAIESNLRVLGPESEKLSVSHHRRLVHVSAIAERRELAAQVLEQGLSVVKLEQLIAAREPRRPPDAPRLGRPPQPEPVKRFRQVDRAIALLKPDAAVTLAPDVAADLLAQGEVTQRALTAWLDALRGQVKVVRGD